MKLLGHMVHNKRWWVLSFKEKENIQESKWGWVSIEREYRKENGREKRLLLKCFDKCSCFRGNELCCCCSFCKVCLDISVNVIVRSIIFIIIKPGDLVKASFCVGRVNMRNSHSSKKVEEEWEKDKILFHKFP